MSNILPILSFDHPSLRRRSPDVEWPRTGLGAMVEDLAATLRGAQGCGIAAPMVGIELNLIYIDNTEVFAGVSDAERKALFPSGGALKSEMINTQILSASKNVEKGAEANLCFPGISVEIERPRSIEVEYQNLAGVAHRAVFEGFDARVILHELDHVHGVLFLDHLSTAKRSLLAGKLKRIARGEFTPGYPFQRL